MSSLQEQDHGNIAITTLFSGKREKITSFAHPLNAQGHAEGDTRATGVFPPGQSPLAFRSSSCMLDPVELPDNTDSPSHDAPDF